MSCVFDITVVTDIELNDRNPYFMQAVATNLMRNQTVLEDLLGRTDSCGIGRTRRKQCDQKVFLQISF
jgi:hypothetical protein